MSAQVDAFSAGERFARLSQELSGRRDLDHCQSCGRAGSVADPEGKPSLWLWQEHDDADRPEGIVVVLCDRCSNRIIEPHPRLYRKLGHYEPFPGALPICTGCVHQDDFRCTHPRAKLNGGEGVYLTFPRPIMAFVDGTRGGRRTGWRENWYTGPVTACDAREEAP